MLHVFLLFGQSRLLVRVRCKNASLSLKGEEFIHAFVSSVKSPVLRKTLTFTFSQKVD